MKNNYEESEVTEIGRAQDIILGSKILTTPYDGSDDLRFQVSQDDDE